MLKLSFPMWRAGTSFRLGKIILPLPFILSHTPQIWLHSLLQGGWKAIHGTSRIVTSPSSQPVKKRSLETVPCCWVGFSAAGAVQYKARWDSNHSSCTEGRVQGLVVWQQPHFHSNICYILRVSGGHILLSFPSAVFGYRMQRAATSTQLSPLLALSNCFCGLVHLVLSSNGNWGALGHLIPWGRGSLACWVSSPLQKERWAERVPHPNWGWAEK